MRPIKFRVWNTEVKKMSKSFNPFVDLFNWKLEEYNTVFMQFTGLHDKNGKEIYEGDIVKIPPPRYFRELVCAIKFSEGRFVGILPEERTLKLWNTSCEVIGNIHESPDLLK